MSIFGEAVNSAELDKIAQRTIAQRLINYNHIDLSIPAQREEANRVREGLGLPHLSELHEPTRQSTQQDLGSFVTGNNVEAVQQ